MDSICALDVEALCIALHIPSTLLDFDAFALLLIIESKVEATLVTRLFILDCG